MLNGVSSELLHAVNLNILTEEKLLSIRLSLIPLQLIRLEKN